MLQMKIQGATPRSGKSLCATCKCATTVRSQNGEEVTFCPSVFGNTAYKSVVPFRVAECATYHPSNMPWLHEMEQMAWVVEARRRGPSGFQQPDDGAMEVIVRRPDERKLGIPDQAGSPTKY